MNRSNTHVLMLSALCFTTTVSAQGDGTVKSIVVDSQLTPLVKQLVKETGDEIEVSAVASVPESMIIRSSRVGISARKWTDNEMARFEEMAGYRPTELYFTAGVVAVLTNPKNPNSSITMEEVRAVFGCNTELTPKRWQTWSGNENPVMKPFAIENGLKFHLKFNQWVTCKEGEYRETQMVVDRDALIDELDSEKSALGYVTYSDEWDKYKTLSIIDKRGDTYDLNKETILSGRYPLSSVYYMYVDLPPHRNYLSSDEKRFVSLALGTEYKQTLNEFGFVSLPPEAIYRNEVRLGITKPTVEGGYK